MKTDKSSKLTMSESEEVGYWRKFNALHAWFVDNVQGGVDECQSTIVTKKQLIKASSLLKKSITAKNPPLRPRRGFFFGSTDIDEWFRENCENAHTTIEKIIGETNFETHNIYYSASW